MTDDLALGLALADLADSITSRYYTGEPIAFEAKGDGSPVTAVDPEVEKALLALVQSERPGDGFLGEEVGWNAGDDESRRRWIIDGIDSTIGFAAGRDDWGTLVALEIDGVIDVGILTCPARKQRYWAQRGHGAFRSDGGDHDAPTRLQVTTAATLGEAAAACLHPPAERCPERFGPMVEQFSASCTIVEHPWHWGVKVAEGTIDVAFYLGGDTWDHAAVVAIVEEAGGSFTDLWGGRRLDTRTAIYSNGPLHGQVLAAIASERPDIES